MVSPRPQVSLHMAAPAVPCPPESSWVQPPWGPLQSVLSTGDTPSIVTEVRDSGCSRVQAGAMPPPWLPPPGCAMGKLRRRTGQGSEAIAGGRGGSPPSCATAVPGAAQPGPSAAIYLPWLARAGGRAVTRRLPNEGRRMAPGSSSCGGGDNGGSRAPNGFSWVSFLTASSPTPLPQQNPGRGSVPWRLGRCD